MLATLVEVYKSQRVMKLWWGATLIKSFRIALGSDPFGHKMSAADGKTPEGNYLVVSHIRHPEFGLALTLSYPDDGDRAVARSKGLDPGGPAMIHGQPGSLVWERPIDEPVDWTSGGIGLTGREMREVWSLVPDNTPVAIYP